MAADVVWSKLAREHLLDIDLRIALASPPAAERLYDRLERRAAGLARQPRMGRRRPDIRPSARVLVEPPSLILDETRPDTDEGIVDEVEIVDVVDGRRDLERLR